MAIPDALRAACRATVGLAYGPGPSALTLVNLLAKARQVGSATDYANLLHELSLDPSNGWTLNGNGNASLSSV